MRGPCGARGCAHDIVGVATERTAPQQQSEGKIAMCDQDHFAEDLKKYSRRDVGSIAAAVGVAMMLPRSAYAVDVKESDVNITTPDGTCDAYFVTPTTGAHAAVLVWPDIFGLRPAMRQMGKRLAEDGYSVLVVNPFYRQQKAPTAPQGAATPVQQDRKSVV